ncbi:hypothetical protein V6N13_109261 [Hibiscus sabdariffa]
MYGFSLWVHLFCGLSIAMPSSLHSSYPARKGLPRIMGACSSASQSRIRKSAGKMNLSIRTRMSSIFPSSYTNE